MAKENNFSDAAKYWQSLFEIDEFEKTINDLWLEVKPLYDELDEYMRFQLISIYGESGIEFFSIKKMIILFDKMKATKLIARIFRLICSEICGLKVGKIYMMIQTIQEIKKHWCNS